MRNVLKSRPRDIVLARVAACILPLLAGCGTATRLETATPTSPVAREAATIGEVAIVDEKRQFVLIDLDSNLYVPAPGTTLRTRNSSGETGHLRASAEQKRPFIAADIVAGNPAVGDQVVR